MIKSWAIKQKFKDILTDRVIEDVCSQQYIKTRSSKSHFMVKRALLAHLKDMSFQYLDQFSSAMRKVWCVPSYTRVTGRGSPGDRVFSSESHWGRGYFDTGAMGVLEIKLGWECALALHFWNQHLHQISLTWYLGLVL